LSASPVTQSAAIWRSPSFSRSSSSTTSTISPRRIRRSASSMGVKDNLQPLSLMDRDSSTGFGSGTSRRARRRPVSCSSIRRGMRTTSGHPWGSTRLRANVAAVQLDDPARDRRGPTRRPPCAKETQRSPHDRSVRNTRDAYGVGDCPVRRRSPRGGPPSAVAIARTIYIDRHRGEWRTGVLDEVRDHLVQAFGVGLERERSGLDLDLEPSPRRSAAAIRATRARASARSRSGRRSSASVPDSRRERSSSCCTRRPSRST
jgi:hypothetical protein